VAAPAQYWTSRLTIGQSTAGNDVFRNHIMSHCLHCFQAESRLSPLIVPLPMHLN
jgi:hypothetical protein